MNPYFDTSFFSFLTLFFWRMGERLLGILPWTDVTSDEIQVAVLAAIGISSALVGTFLILRKNAMLANSLSHTILLGIVLAFLGGSSINQLHEGKIDLPLMLGAAFLVALLTAFITEFLTKVAKLQEDASTGIVFTTFFALGILLVNLLTRNAHIGAEVVMGNVDALHPDDFKLAFIILIINLVSIVLFYKEWQITTFDSSLAKALGFSPPFFNYMLMILVSMTVVGAFRAVGVLMVLTFITAPPLTARLFCHRLWTMLLGAASIALFMALLGVALSRHLLSVHNLALSTGGVVTTLMGSLFLISALWKKTGKNRLVFNSK